VRLLTDLTGTVTDTYDFDAFGNEVNATGITPNVYLYRGEQYDSDVGLYYLRARYFDPLTGGFLTRDSDVGDITNPVTLAKYRYAIGDPVNFSDPSGNTALAPPAPRSGFGPIEYTLLVAMGVSTAAAIYAVEKPIKCVWCEAISQLAAGLYVDLLPANIHAIGEVAGRTLCTVAVLTAPVLPWYFARGPGRGLPPQGIAPPIPSPCHPGPSSRTGKKGGDSLWDGSGGEWRWDPGDTWHNPHWDHNPHTAPNCPWENIPHGGLPPVKPVPNPPVGPSPSPAPGPPSPNPAPSPTTGGGQE